MTYQCIYIELQSGPYSWKVFDSANWHGTQLYTGDSVYLAMIELPIIMASLDIDDSPVPPAEAPEGSGSTDKNPTTRTLRKRVHKPLESSKRRCNMRPTKLNTSQELGDINNYFMSKKLRTLATIYEEPKVKKNGAVVHTGATKIRHINFNAISREKLRKRKARMKKAMCHKSPRKGRLSMEAFLARLRGLMTSPPNSTANRVTSCDLK
ncbi:uncharacterized protein [Periplaneta americana]|uniref:uncharacterized protein isoform X2 n=1 Tax=Periplaneta americana TaxID=6978 RepID=UPI0037E94519